MKSGALLENEFGQPFYVNPAHVTYIFSSERGFGLVDLHLTDDTHGDWITVKGNVHTVAKALGWT